MKVLYINSCVREESRTDRLARKVLARYGEYEEVNLEKENLQPLTRETLAYRDACIAAGNLSDPMFDYAKQFATADIIVISAPFWDYSFPASLKIYFENIFVVGLVSKYDDHGMPIGLCKGQKLYYVTTAGGPYVAEFSYGYVESLAKQAFGILETKLISAEMMDVVGYNSEEILRQVEETLA